MTVSHGPSPPCLLLFGECGAEGDDIFYEVEQGRLYNLSLFSTSLLMFFLVAQRLSYAALPASQ